MADRLRELANLVQRQYGIAAPHVKARRMHADAHALASLAIEAADRLYELQSHMDDLRYMDRD